MTTLHGFEMFVAEESKLVLHSSELTCPQPCKWLIVFRVSLLELVPATALSMLFLVLTFVDRFGVSV